MRVTSLTVLQMAHNSLVEITTWIWKLSRLTALNVEDNPLESSDLVYYDTMTVKQLIEEVYDDLL